MTDSHKADSSFAVLMNLDDTLAVALTGKMGGVVRMPEKIVLKGLKGIGGVAIEAAASGAVPIVHDSGGSREIVQKGRNGFTYESPTQAVSIVKLVLQNRKKWSKYSNMAVERSRDFDASTLQNQIIPLLSSF